jgi:hypothetical protein
MPMLLRSGPWLALWIAIFPLAAAAAAEKPCVAPEEAGKYLNKDICISAYIYEVVELGNGTRFLDLCPPQTPDDQCRFTIVSFKQDRKETGDLKKYLHTDVRVRGVVQPMRGRTAMVLSHVRQFSGGAGKFRPNPRLLSGFNAGESSPPLSDPNLQSQGTARSFMNSSDRETLPSR